MNKYNKRQEPVLNHSIGADIDKNTHIRSAEQMYRRLNDIRLGKVDFIPQDMSMAANCLELYYKELAFIKNVESADRFQKGHSLYGLAKSFESNGIVLCEGGKSKKQWFYDVIHDMQGCYISTKYYGHEPNTGDFREAMKLLKKQREVVLTILDPSKSWHKETDTMVKVMGKPLFKEDNEEDNEESREL